MPSIPRETFFEVVIPCKEYAVAERIADQLRTSRSARGGEMTLKKRLKIIMDYDHEIKPDGETNWVDAPFDIVWSVSSAIYFNRETLVIQP